MIRIDLNTKKKLDALDGIDVNLQAAAVEAFFAAENEIRSDIVETFGEKAHWFDIVSDPVSMEIEIRPTGDVSSSDEKMRLYKYLIGLHGESLLASSKRCLKKNIALRYKDAIGGRL